MSLTKKYLTEKTNKDCTFQEYLNVSKEEGYLETNTQAFMLMTFPNFGAILSAILWDNKFTLFMAIIISFIHLFTLFASYVSLRDFKKEVKRLNDKYDKLEG